MDAESLRRRAQAITWFHSMDLGQGIRTAGLVRPEEKLRTLSFDADLSGRSVLDVGAWDGFFSFEAERRSARSVTAIDPFAWRGNYEWASQAGFNLAREAYGSKVMDKDIALSDVSPATTGMFDVVLFLGVLYHLPHPWSILERMAAVTAEKLILETHVDLQLVRRPAFAFYPGSELGGDDSNWWGPNLSAVVAILKDVGFSRVELMYRRPIAWRGLSAAYSVLRGPRQRLSQGRAVFHAWR
ncbi:MAG: class I SAM-dependent methyltransferase [Acidimicrobiales bacterium]